MTSQSPPFYVIYDDTTSVGLTPITGVHAPTIPTISLMGKVENLLHANTHLNGTSQHKMEQQPTPIVGIQVLSIRG